ncbi:MAG: DUF3343 domain-containing protein [Clostridiales bacterium]|nr:DUF3343 domain-containing protein [Clostridiales bacterium]
MALYLNVSSVTNAMRGRSLLEGNGIHATVSRALEPDGTNGCGYSIRVQERDAERAEKLIRSIGIPIRGKRTEAGES